MMDELKAKMQKNLTIHRGTIPGTLKVLTRGLNDELIERDNLVLIPQFSRFPNRPSVYWMVSVDFKELTMDVLHLKIGDVELFNLGMGDVVYRAMIEDIESGIRSYPDRPGADRIMFDFVKRLDELQVSRVAITAALRNLSRNYRGLDEDEIDPPDQK